MAAAAPAKPAGPTPPKNPISWPNTATNWMDPSTNAQLTKQATDTITKSFAPQLVDLNSQQSRAQAISDKRGADNRYYQTWLDSQMAGLSAHADAANKALSDSSAQLTSAQNALYGSQAGNLVDQANARVGNVSQNAGSNAFGQDLYQGQQANKSLLMNATQQGAEDVRTGVQSVDAARANNTAYIQGAQMRQLADLQGALNKISDARTKIQSEKTAGIAKEIARLQGVEIQKVQSNRSYNAALQKLAITGANTKSQIDTRAAQLKINQQNADTSLTKAQQDKMNADRNFQLERDKYGLAYAKDKYQRDNGLGPYKSSGAGNGVLTAASQNKIYGQVSAVQGRLRQLTATGLSPGAAWQALHTGTLNGKPLKAGAVETILLNAAYNTSISGLNGLSPGDVSSLKTRYGLTDPGGRLGTASAKFPGL